VGAGYQWYLDRVHDKVQQAMREAGSQQVCCVTLSSSVDVHVHSTTLLTQPRAVQVDLVGHSAGGWLARAYLADEKYHGTQLPAPAVRTLVTLGAPHLAPPKGVPGVFDATRGALDWLNDTYPGAHFASIKVRC
jgi:alpha-beta hydrolase superfamily lysophospholipase